MKSIIIAGPARSGKSTLAKKLSEELNCFVINVDKLVAVFNGAYPQLDIRLNWNRKKTTDNIAPFLGHFLGAFSSESGVVNELNMQKHAVKGNRFVMEGGYFNFEKILPVLKEYGMDDLRNNFILIGLVQNNKTADEYVRDFKKYDTEDDWTYGWSDEEYREYAVQDAIPTSQLMTKHLNKHGFTIYDTSRERKKMFGKIIEDIKAELVSDSKEATNDFK